MQGAKPFLWRPHKSRSSEEGFLGTEGPLASMGRGEGGETSSHPMVGGKGEGGKMEWEGMKKRTAVAAEQLPPPGEIVN